MRPSVMVFAVFAAALFAWTGTLSLHIAAGARSTPSAALRNQNARPKLVVGANVLIDHDFDAPHGESLLAIDPRNGKNLIAASMTYARTDEGTYIKTYASSDGGYAWNDASPLGDRRLIRSFDPQVAFGPAGLAYLVVLRDESRRSVMEVYRSSDVGLTWRKTARLPGGDHEQLAVDLSSGSHRGRIYIAIPQGSGGNLYLYTSDDNGVTFAPRRFIAPGRPSRDKAFYPFAQTNGLVVLRDGTLVVGIVRYRGLSKLVYTSSFSTDGGESFGPELKITDAPETRFPVTGDLTKNSSWPGQLGADTYPSPYANRIYAAWPAFVLGHARIYVAYSADHGTSWSAPTLIGIGYERGDGNDHAALAVNGDGVAGITFHHAPVRGARNRFDLYFSASTDGGASWLAPVRVSSQTSYPVSPGNLRPIAEVSRGLSVRYFNALGEETVGGDYMGLATGPGGTFQALWQDSRNGAFHLYTAKIRLERQDSKERNPLMKPRALNSDLALAFDPASYDGATGDYVLPIRLKNISQETILGPITARLLQFQDPGVRKYRPVEFITVMNATNQKRGVGAVIDYTKALGASQELLPGALTEAVTWRIHLRNPIELVFVTLKFDVRGFVRGSGNAAMSARRNSS